MQLDGTAEEQYLALGFLSQRTVAQGGSLTARRPVVSVAQAG